MELLTKAVDAASMFWQALDERERQLLMYAGCWLVVSALIAWHRRDREQLKAELREELAVAGGSR